MPYNPIYLRQLIATTLKLMDMYSPVAAELLLLTAAHESHLGSYLQQEGGGPALGIYQMEPATMSDIYRNYLAFRPERSRMLQEVTRTDSPSIRALQFDPVYSTALARIHYRRVKEHFPRPGDLHGLASYAKRYWNTMQGEATVVKYKADYQHLVLV